VYLTKLEREAEWTRKIVQGAFVWCTLINAATMLLILVLWIGSIAFIFAVRQFIGTHCGDAFEMGPSQFPAMEGVATQDTSDEFEVGTFVSRTTMEASNTIQTTQTYESRLPFGTPSAGSIVSSDGLRQKRSPFGSVAQDVASQHSLGRICHKCGNQLMDDAVFCRKCGTKVSEAPTFNEDVDGTIQPVSSAKSSEAKEDDGGTLASAKSWEAPPPTASVELQDRDQLPLEESRGTLPIQASWNTEQASFASFDFSESPSVPMIFKESESSVPSVAFNVDAGRGSPPAAPPQQIELKRRDGDSMMS